MKHMRVRLFFILISVLLVLPGGVALAAAGLDIENSRISVDKTTLKADGIDNARVTVTVKDTNLVPMTGKKVVLTSSRGKLDEIRIESDLTDSLGKAYFRIFSLKDGTPIFSASVDGVVLPRMVSVVYSGGLSFPLQPGDLIKIPDDGDTKTLNDTAVYYYGADGRRYVFPNEKTYFTWYPDFSKVQIIPLDQMSLIPIGSNVTYHPGTRLIKFQTDPKTYMVTRGGVLRWAKTEAVADGWFGTKWNTFVDDVSAAFYINYTFGTPVESHLDLALDIIYAGTATIGVDKGIE